MTLHHWLIIVNSLVFLCECYGVSSVVYSFENEAIIETSTSITEEETEDGDFLFMQDELIEIEEFVFYNLAPVGPYTVDDTMNPVSGDNGEVFVSTANLNAGSFSHQISEATTTSVSLSVSDLGFVTYSGDVYIALAFYMNETRNRADFIVDAFSIEFNSNIIYDLDSSVHYFPVADDPLTSAINDAVEFHQGSTDIDAAIFIPVSILTDNGVSLSDTLTIEYFITELDGGPDNLVTASDGTSNPIPEPSIFALFSLGLVAALAYRKR